MPPFSVNETCLPRALPTRAWSIVSPCSVPRSRAIIWPLLVVPGAAADPVASVDRGHPVLRLLAQIRVPHHATATSRGTELLTMRVRARQTTIIRAVTLRRAGDEEGHRRRRARRAAGTLSTAAPPAGAPAPPPPRCPPAPPCAKVAVVASADSASAARILSRLTHLASPSNGGGPPRSPVML